MSKRNSSSPWNPAFPVEITPQEYEQQVVEWLRSTGESLTRFQINHLQHLHGSGGEYEFDAVAEFTILDGAQIVVLVECKRYSRPVERKHIMALWAKLQDVSAHKAMIFATCGFQSGALRYARNKKIATITFVSGEFFYETRALDIPSTPSPWVDLPKFAGIVISYNDDGRIVCETVDSQRIRPIREWLIQ